LSLKRRTVVLVALTALIAGAALGSLVLAPYVSPSAKTGEGLNVEGYATINVLNSAGQVVYTWQGHNELFSWTMSDIAACLSGNSTTSYNFGACSGWTPWVYINWQVGNNSYDLASHSSIALLPAGCNPRSPYGGQNCRGWVAEGSFGPNSFTQANCGTCTITGVVTGGAGTADFDTLTTSIPVSAGDSLLVTVDFNVS
jgi:hypothetical protein